MKRTMFIFIVGLLVVAVISGSIIGTFLRGPESFVLACGIGVAYGLLFPWRKVRRLFRKEASIES